MILQSAMPAAPSASSALGFIDALSSFSSSFSRLGSVLERQYQLDLKKSEAAATTDLAALSTTEAISYAEKVKAENKNRALVDGTMQAFGAVLANRLQNEALGLMASGQLTAEAAPDFVKGRAQQYSQQFDNPAFKKTFGPVASDLIGRMEAVQLKDRAEQYKQTYMQGILAWASEARTASLKLPEDQQYTAVQGWFDAIVEKASKDGLLDKKDVNTLLKTAASVAADQGDVIAAKALLEKKRGDQPALSEFDPQAGEIISHAEQQNIKLNKVHIEETKRDLTLAAYEGRLGGVPAWQDKNALIKMGIGGSEQAQLQKLNEDATRSRVYERESAYVQEKMDAIAQGKLDRLPSIDNPGDRGSSATGTCCRRRALPSEQAVRATERRGRASYASRYEALNLFRLRVDGPGLDEGHAFRRL
jgi:hypothetical protein